VIANVLIPGRRSRGFSLTCVIGAAVVLLGGWAATRLFLIVIAGAILLLACHPLTERPGQRAHR
jgi:O-antigen ligase